MVKDLAVIGLLKVDKAMGTGGKPSGDTDAVSVVVHAGAPVEIAPRCVDR